VTVGTDAGHLVIEASSGPDLRLPILGQAEPRSEPEESRPEALFPKNELKKENQDKPPEEEFVPMLPLGNRPVPATTTTLIGVGDKPVESLIKGKKDGLYLKEIEIFIGDTEGVS